MYELKGSYTLMRDMISIVELTTKNLPNLDPIKQAYIKNFENYEGIEKHLKELEASKDKEFADGAKKLHTMLDEIRNPQHV